MGVAPFRVLCGMGYWNNVLAERLERDLVDFVDFDYIARVTAVYAATVWALATAPGTPKTCKSTPHRPPASLAPP